MTNMIKTLLTALAFMAMAVTGAFANDPITIATAVDQYKPNVWLTDISDASRKPSKMELSATLRLDIRQETLDGLVSSMEAAKDLAGASKLVKYDIRQETLDSSVMAMMKNSAELTDTWVPQYVGFHQKTVGDRLPEIMAAPIASTSTSGLLQYADIRQETLDGRSVSVQRPQPDVLLAWDTQTANFVYQPVGFEGLGK